jgi:hypothetical protein
MLQASLMINQSLPTTKNKINSKSPYHDETSRERAFLLPTDTKPRKPLIWARVSTKGQKEISPDSQISRCKELLITNKIVEAPIVLSVDFCSLRIFDCKEFQDMRDMIRHGEISVLCCYDRDRLDAIPPQRSAFIAETLKMKTEILLCNGPPVMAGRWGELAEFQQAIMKEMAVLRTRTGATDGLHDKVTLKHRPTSFHRIYAMLWDKLNLTIKRNPDLEDEMILFFSLLKQGKSEEAIQNAFHDKAIPSPSGLEWWTKGTIANIAVNPVYAGKYAGLKTKTVYVDEQSKPQRKKIPESEYKFIDEVKVEKPFITWEEHLHLVEQFGKHVAYAGRNAHRLYLLASMITCDQHDCHLWGHTDKQSYDYRCVVGKCHFSIDGRKIERVVMDTIKKLFSRTDKPFWQKIEQLEKIDMPLLDNQLKKQQQKLTQTNQLIANLEERKMKTGIGADNLTPDTYELLSNKWRTQLLNIQKDIQELENQIAQNHLAQEKARSFEKIKADFMDVLNGYLPDGDILFEPDPIKWRQLLEALSVEIHVLDNTRKQTEAQFLEQVKREGKEVTKGNWDDIPPDWENSDDNNYGYVLEMDGSDHLLVMTLKGALVAPTETIAAVSSSVGYDQPCLCQ